MNEAHAKRGWNKPAPWWVKEVSAAVLEAPEPLLADEIARTTLRHADENEPVPHGKSLRHHARARTRR